MMHENLIDLASARLGGKALLASDEFFAPKENLLAPGRGEFIEGKYTDRGKWMDGWETRRRRDSGYDWCVIQLGVPGAIRAITVDTNHFRGNHPAACSVDGASLSGTVARKRLRTLDRAFTEVLARSPLTGHAENRFTVESHTRCTHVRLNIYPDGGVARLRVWGEARPDWQRIARAGRTVDLVAVEHGGLPLATSDQFFSEPEPDHARPVARYGRWLGDTPAPRARARLGGAAARPPRRDRARRSGHYTLQGQLPGERKP